MKKPLVLLFITTFGLLVLRNGSANGQTNLTVKTDKGQIEGYANNDIRIFKGIPFAAPPVGNLRWRAPQPAQAWVGTKPCKAFGPSPMQASPMPFMYWSSEFLIPKEPISEDCLYLNVWTGSKQPTEKRPVLVYIYGGGFRSGGTGCPIYDGEAMAKKGVVFVSINYRVGVFGFLAHPELSKESGQNASGNYALMDMLAALQWVKKNITAFGGDPTNVTIAGQSAGAFAVNYLVASPLSKGLFHRAIAQSGGSFYANPLRANVDMKSAEEMGVKYAASLKCNNMAALRAKSSAEILTSQGGLQGPLVDGYVIPESILDIFSKGKQNDVSTMVGWNEDDRVSGPPVKATAFKEQIQKRFGDKATAFLEAYPADNEDQAANAQSAMGRDEVFGFQDYSWAKIQANTGKSKAYIYNFNRKLPAHTAETAFGAFHSGEIVYAYNNLHTLDRPWEAIDRQIADMMSSYWVNFAKTGNPNGKGLPSWLAYDSTKETALVIDKTTESKPLPTRKQMAFWEEYYRK